MEFLAFTLGSILTDWIVPFLLFILGLGAVVFVHELGHFVVAKAVGIKVERFALGFGPRLFGLRSGETDYCVNAVPLGGYVKMLGQEDFAPNAEQQDPRAYGNKSVGARFAVIAAGVIMNAIFAAILFIIVGLVGIKFLEPVIGDVVPGAPAERAEIVWDEAPDGEAQTQPARTTGLEGGDRVLAIDGEEAGRFLDLVKHVIYYGGGGDPVELRIARTVDGQTRRGTATVKPEDRPHPVLGDRLPAIGVRPPSSTEVAVGEGAENPPFRDRDRIVAIAGEPVEDYWDVRPILRKTVGRETLPVTVVRGGETVELEVTPSLAVEKTVYLKDGTRIHGVIVDRETTEDEPTRVTIRRSDGSTRTVPEDQIAHEKLDVLGMIPRLKIDSVMPDSPAREVELRAGDIIVAYADRTTPTWQQQLNINEEVAGSEGPTTITVLRDGERITKKIHPMMQDGRAIIGFLPGADVENLVVAGVRPTSPVAEAGVRPGDRILRVNEQEVATWAELIAALRERIGGEVTLIVARGEQEMEIPLGAVTAEQLRPEAYINRLGVRFYPLQFERVFQNPFAAVAWGAEQTVNQIIEVYITLRSLLSRQLTTKAVSGPVGIGAAAVSTAREGLTEFVYFMAIISAILAVMNFLPLPVLDGGHAVLLLIEKIRGKPVPLKIVNIIQYAGLILLLLVFLAVTFQDILRLIE